MQARIDASQIREQKLGELNAFRQSCGLSNGDDDSDSEDDSEDCRAAQLRQKRSRQQKLPCAPVSAMRAAKSFVDDEDATQLGGFQGGVDGLGDSDDEAGDRGESQPLLSGDGRGGGGGGGGGGKKNGKKNGKSAMHFVIDSSDEDDDLIDDEEEQEEAGGNKRVGKYGTAEAGNAGLPSVSCPGCHGSISVASSHRCVTCRKGCHPFCGTAIGEEGFGQAVLCPPCGGFAGAHAADKASAVAKPLAARGGSGKKQKTRR